MKHQPLVQEIKTPLSAKRCFGLIAARPHSFFLDSGMDAAGLGRYSFMGSNPFLVMTSRGNEITLTYDDGRRETLKGNPFDVLGGFLESYSLAAVPELPFAGGAVGYLSYDLCHFVERLPQKAVDDLKLPETYLAFYDAVIAFDHLEGKVYVASSGLPETEEEKRQLRAKERLKELKSLIEKGKKAAGSHSADMPETELKANFTKKGYLKAVADAREYILAGDIFQVNLSQRFEASLEVPPYELFCRLRQINPAPFAAYLGFEDMAVVSASPERFLRVRGDEVQTRPIKGTRRRGVNAAEDAILAEELLASEKDRAENVMIVDLERNDLGRVCRYGSVKVTELAELETFPTVFHLTSTVEGRLRPGMGRIDLLKATFPGGSITGAPKVRAMEIIDELEPTRRSVYTGAIGYLGFGGEMDLNIVIRTFIIKEGKAYFQVGGGIVYDSEPEAEYRETLHKAKALIQALGLTPKTDAEGGV